MAQSPVTTKADWKVRSVIKATRQEIPCSPRKHGWQSPTSGPS